MKPGYATAALLILLIVAFAYTGLGLYLIYLSNPSFDVSLEKAFFGSSGLKAVFLTTLSFTSDPGGLFTGAININLVDTTTNVQIGICKTEEFSIEGLRLYERVTVTVPYSKIYTGAFNGFLFNETNVMMNVTVTIYNIFVRVYAIQTAKSQWGPPFGNFTIYYRIHSLNRTHNVIRINIAFNNWSIFNFKGRFKILVNNKYEGFKDLEVDSGEHGEAIINVYMPKGERLQAMMLYIIPARGAEIGPYQVV